jgi:hypothetical protein
MTDKLAQRPMRVERGDLLGLVTFLDGLARDDGQGSDVRADAAHWANALCSLLAYGSPKDERWIDMVPAGLKIPYHYVSILELAVAELDDDVKATMPGRLTMARQMAEQADNADYCTDMRLDALDALQTLLSGIEADALEVEVEQTVD